MAVTVTAMFFGDMFIGCFVSEKEAQRWATSQGRFLAVDDPAQGIQLVSMSCEVNR